METKNIVVVEVDGRLGNVCYKMASAYYYANKTNRELYVYSHIPYWEDYYKSYKYFHKFPEYKGDFKDFVEYHEDKLYNFMEIPLFEGKNVHLCGNWESELYFPDREMINELYKCPKDIEEKILKKYPDINSYVGISIRRGDYLSCRHIFKIPKLTWFKKCYEKYFQGRKALIFSDDIEWCEQNLGNNPNYIFHKKETTSDRYMVQEPELNLYTMALCHDHICSNSTWAWWGARICEQDNAINVFPDKWFTKESNIIDENYIPDRWIKEETEYE